MSILIKIILFFIPRFITKNVTIALHPDNNYNLICTMRDIDFEGGEQYDGVVTLNSFTFLGWAWPVGLSEYMEMEVRAWPKEKSC